MTRTVLALAALAAMGFAGAAFAGDATDWSTSTTTATAPTAMSDSDMDKVTAGGQPTFELDVPTQAAYPTPTYSTPGGRSRSSSWYAGDEPYFSHYVKSPPTGLGNLSAAGRPQ